MYEAKAQVAIAKRMKSRNVVFLNTVCRLSVKSRESSSFTKHVGVRIAGDKNIFCVLLLADIYFSCICINIYLLFLTVIIYPCNICIVNTFLLELIVSIHLLEYVLRKCHPKQPCYFLYGSLIITISCDLISTEMCFLRKCGVVACLLKSKLNKLP